MILGHVEDRAHFHQLAETLKNGDLPTRFTTPCLEQWTHRHDPVPLHFDTAGSTISRQSTQRPLRHYSSAATGCPALTTRESLASSLDHYSRQAYKADKMRCSQATATIAPPSPNTKNRLEIPLGRLLHRQIGTGHVTDESNPRYWLRYARPPSLKPQPMIQLGCTSEAAALPFRARR